jgi:hypothetical protein
VLEIDMVGPMFKDCPRITINKALREPLGKNPNGLLYKVMSEGSGTFEKDVLTAEDCERYANWLARYEVKDIGRYRFSYGLFDREDMQSTLGKDMYQWDPMDAENFVHLAKTCQSFITSQADEGYMKLAQQITNYGWTPTPLDQNQYDSNGSPEREWIEIEKLLYEITGSRENVEQQIAELKASDASIPVLSTVNGYIDEITGRTRLASILSEAEKRDLLETYEAQHGRIASGVVDRAINEMSGQMSTLEQIQAARDSTKRLKISLQQQRAKEHANDLDSRFSKLAGEKALPLWQRHISEYNTLLQRLSEAGFEKSDKFLAMESISSELGEFLYPSSSKELSGSYSRLVEDRRALSEKMLQRSSSDIAAWISEMPPSNGAAAAIELFNGRLGALGIDLSSVENVRKAIGEKLASYNPKQYSRPDIVMSLIREQWIEVELYDLDDLAYLYTLFREIRPACERSLEANAGPLYSLTTRLSNSATQRVLSGGPTTRSEAERVFFLIANNIFNQPGCRVNYWGMVESCTSEADHAAAQELIMTSGDGARDGYRFSNSGCSGDFQTFMSNLVEYGSRYASFRPARPLKIADFYTYMGER